MKVLNSIFKRKDIFYKTKRSIIVISTLIVFLCLFIFAFITQGLYTSRVFNNVDRQLINEVRKIENPFPNHPKVNFNNRVEVKKLFIAPNIISIIYEHDSVIAISPNAYFSEDSLPNFKKASDGKIVDIVFNGYNFRGITFTEGAYRFDFLINVDVEINSINQLMSTIIMSLIILMLIALMLAIFLASRIIKPVKEAYDKQVFFVQDASHEMRTPLAVIKGKLELLANSYGDTIESHFEHISKMMSEVRGLEKLNNDLLTLSKEDVDSNVNIEEVSINKFVNDVSDFYFDLAEMQDKIFKVVNLNDDLNVQWDYIKVKRMFVILIENAFKYTNEGSIITLEVSDFNKNIKVKVIDTGIGITEEDQKRIFDRFFRSADVRGKNISGSGIGLSLLKSIAKTLGVKIKVTSEYGVGTEFELIIPKVIK